MFEWWPSAEQQPYDDSVATSWYDESPYSDPYVAPAVDGVDVVVGSPDVVSSLSTVAVVGLAVAGALGIYLIYTASKTTGPLTQRLGDAVIDSLTSQGKVAGRAAGKHAGKAAGSLLADAIGRRLGSGRSGKPAPRHVQVASVRELGRD